jgi:hypothetical protein
MPSKILSKHFHQSSEEEILSMHFKYPLMQAKLGELKQNYFPFSKSYGSDHLSRIQLADSMSSLRALSLAQMCPFQHDLFLLLDRQELKMVLAFKRKHSWLRGEAVNFLKHSLEGEYYHFCDTLFFKPK